MKKCIICGEKLKPGSNRLTAALWHFRPLELKQWPWFRGTVKHCGLGSAIWLMSPLLNTLRHWKYRKAKLASQFCALDDLPTERRKVGELIMDGKTHSVRL